MSRLLAHFLLVFWLPSLAAGQTQSDWSQRQVESQALGAPLEYRVFLPASYEREPHERYPVIFWLHGLGGSPASAAAVVAELADAISDGRVPPLILVSCSDVTSRSMWTDAKDGSLPIETAIVRELVPHIDATYRTRASRQFRAIEGFSMGGYGAAYIGFKYPELFGSVSILSGALHTGESLKTNRPGIFDAVHGGDMAYAEKHSPWSVVRDNADRIRGKTEVRIHVGADDALVERNERYHELLEELGIDHEWSIVPDAPHNLAILLANWDGDPLTFYANAFSTVPAR